MTRRKYFIAFSALGITLAACQNPSPDEAPPPGAVTSLGAESPLSAAQARGQSVFRECAKCHFGSADGRHGVGPNLYDVAGNPAGRYADFRYSAALKRSNIVWDDATLDQYLARPQSVIPGGRMSYAGMKDPDDRAAVIAYLKTLRSPDPGADQ